MKINIVGPGNMGRAIATRALTGGHGVCLVHPDADPARAAAEELQQRFPDGTSEWASSAGAADITVLALPYDTSLQVARSTGTALAGQVLVDICNPVDFSTMDSRVTAPDSSAAEEIQQIVGPDVKVVKAFNTTFAGLLAAGEGHGLPLDVLIAGDDSAAKEKVAEFPLRRDAPAGRGPPAPCPGAGGTGIPAHLHPAATSAQLAELGQNSPLTDPAARRG